MRKLVVLALATGTLLLPGCGTKPEVRTAAVGAPLPPAPLPAYAVGQSFTYVTHTGEEVTSRVAELADGRVRWESSDGSSATTQSPLDGWVSYRNGTGEGTVAYDGDPAALFPLEVGRARTVAYKGVHNGNANEGESACRVEGAEAIEVPAGTFDSYKVVCVRGRQTRTYWYAPSIGGTVMQVTERQGELGSEWRRLARHAARQAG